ncbi:MAG: hypothetical protein KGO93_08040 [Cyanobacteria bacterium REEB446]|jgi:hypothetical protein|nr:hypothetical protein [Cyanobacteria bacterium REEB446]
MRKFQKLNELRIDLIKSLGIGLCSPIATIVFMTAVDRSYLVNKIGLEGLLTALFLLVCGLKCISKVYTIAESFDLLNERGDDDKSV